MKTYTATPSDIEKKWWLIDAEDLILGRLAVEVADLLRGKHKTTYTPHMDCGDHVVIINAEKIHLTGNKRVNKRFYWHTGYPGGIKDRTIEQILDGRHPERVIQKAVQRMLPSGPLARQQLSNLRVYAGTEHPHGAQQPAILDIAGRNSKNKRAVN